MPGNYTTKLTVSADGDGNAANNTRWRGYVVWHIAASYAICKRVRYCEMRRKIASVESAGEQLARAGSDS